MNLYSLNHIHSLYKFIWELTLKKNLRSANTSNAEETMERKAAARGL